MAQAPIQVVWFKRDLRIHDHAPLADACMRSLIGVALLRLK
tara:strand:+ start:1029 stop:1151 length:123 start_codon:yes stop_codon:yes gene_type:complete